MFYLKLCDPIFTIISSSIVAVVIVIVVNIESSTDRTSKIEMRKRIQTRHDENRGNADGLLLILSTFNRINSWGRRRCCLFYFVDAIWFLFVFFLFCQHFFSLAICLAFICARFSSTPYIFFFLKFFFFFHCVLFILVCIYAFDGTQNLCPFCSFGTGSVVVQQEQFLTFKIVCWHLKSSIIVKMGLFAHNI